MAAISPKYVMIAEDRGVKKNDTKQENYFCVRSESHFQIVEPSRCLVIFSTYMLRS